jgi:hypothetical protein
MSLRRRFLRRLAVTATAGWLAGWARRRDLAQLMPLRFMRP